jgi:cytosine/adenosine deaminase-related metal-dependent hydrolase
MPPVDPLDSPRTILEGRIVTMNADFDVLASGRLYLEAGRIAAVQPTDAPPPAAFVGTPVNRTGGTLFPGMIELHNHLSYNTLPMWKLDRQFGNRDQWARLPEYKQRVSRPASILGTTDGLVQAVVRYVEVKCLAAGVTTTQGIALASNNGIKRYYRGVVRNAEQTDDPDLPEASTRIADVDAADAAAFLTRLQSDKVLLLHLSEGVDEIARKHFSALKIDDASWAITAALGGIHCCGLRDTDYGTYAGRGGTMIWSPFSNLLLYGRTTDIGRAKQEGVLMALGSDWSPTGSKNMLGELKVARLASDEAGGVFRSRDLVAMATVNAARLLRWDRELGSLEPGKRADIVVIDGRQGDPYDQLIEARETAVTLVLINGVPRYGSRRLMGGANAAGETCRVGASTRLLNLAQASADPIVGAVSLASAREQLADALQRLPELSSRPRALDAFGARAAGGAADNRERWVLDLDHAPLDGSTVRLMGDLGAGANALEATRAPDLPLVPLELDPLTVVDDRDFPEVVRAQPNLSTDIRRELPRLYGG